MSKEKRLEGLDSNSDIIEALGYPVQTLEDEKQRFVDFGSSSNFVNVIDECVKNGWSTTKTELKCIRDNASSGQGDDWAFGSFKDADRTRTAAQLGLGSESVINKIREIKKQIEYNKDLQILSHKKESYKRKRVYGLDGDELDIDRLLCGDPEHWQSTTKGKKDNTVTLGINMAQNGGADEDDFARIAATCICACDLLTTMGYSVQITGFISCLNAVIGLGLTSCVFTLKDSMSPIDEARLSIIGAPGLYRAYGFLAWNCAFGHSDKFYYGSRNRTPKELKDKLGVDYMFERVRDEGEEMDEMDEIAEIVNIIKKRDE